ncbi:iron transporter [Halococcus agarilyticus]|uniref:iron transporter n=1 Tax=Halococcus agarilyticus TaxID=1232219 RepID=UPI0006779F67|nr:iron transporter [Halococcus agarilyticus]
MDRRTFLRASAGMTGSVALAGCAGLFSVRRGDPPLVENRPNAVYYPTHTEGMEMVGMSGMGGMAMNDSGGMGNMSDMGGMDSMNDSGGMAMNDSSAMSSNASTNGDRNGASNYAFGVMYSYPHRFWTVNGSETRKVSIQQDDSVHLMASVWEPKTRTVLPDTGLSVEITQDGEIVSQEVIYPMLSQRMGFHYGANFGLEGNGTYTATLSVGGMSTRRTGEFVGMFAEPASVDIEFEYSRTDKKSIDYTRTKGQREGSRDAAKPMAMEMVPNSTVPPKADLPGEIVGTRTSGDGRFLATVLDEPPRGIDASGPYLAVSARTPYNRMVLPAMALSGTLRRNGRTVFDGPLQPTLDPELDYHYGTVVDSIESGDELGLSVETPPQVARHEGYETAFLDMPPMTFTV